MSGSLQWAVGSWPWAGKRILREAGYQFVEVGIGGQLKALAQALA